MNWVMVFLHKVIVQCANFRMIWESSDKLQWRTSRSAMMQLRKLMVIPRFS